MYWLNVSGLKDLLPELLKTRIYAGISAGSIVASKTLALLGQDKKDYYRKHFNYEIDKCLDYVDFYIRPHFGAESKESVTPDYFAEKAKRLSKTVYALDHDSALKVIDGKVEVISEGKYLKLN